MQLAQQARRIAARHPEQKAISHYLRGKFLYDPNRRPGVTAKFVGQALIPLRSGGERDRAVWTLHQHGYFHCLHLTKAQP
jgi:hypothetical protein